MVRILQPLPHTGDYLLKETGLFCERNRGSCRTGFMYIRDIRAFYIENRSTIVHIFIEKIVI